MKFKIPPIPVVSPVYRLLHDEGFITALLVFAGFLAAASIPQIAAQIPWLEGIAIVIYLGLIGRFSFAHLVEVLGELPASRKEALSELFADALKDLGGGSTDGAVTEEAKG